MSFLFISTRRSLEEILRGIASRIGRAMRDRSENFHQVSRHDPDQSMHRRPPDRMPRRVARRARWLQRSLPRAAQVPMLAPPRIGAGNWPYTVTAGREGCFPIAGLRML